MNSEELKEYRKRFYDNLELYMKEKSLDEIVDLSISQTQVKSENTNKIMVCIGSYVEVKEGLGIKRYLTYKSEYNIDYRLYTDLETHDIYKVKNDKIKEFERDYNVIYMPVAIYNVQEYYKKLSELRREFFKNLLYNDQEDVILKLTKHKDR